MTNLPSAGGSVDADSAAVKRIYARVFALYTSLPIDCIDTCHAALTEDRHGYDFFSYDAEFDKVPELVQREP